MVGKKRGNGEGSIFYRKSDGRWCTAISLGWDAKGKPRRHTIYGKTRKEVATKLAVALRARDEGRPVVVERQTVGQYLEQWLTDVAAQRLRPKTLHSYRQIVRLHITPALGKVQLGKLTPQQVQGMLNDRTASGLSPRTVQYMRAVLSAALSQALRWGMVPRNVATLVEPPRSEAPDRATLDPDQARALLEAAAGTRYEVLYHTALLLGLRQGELLGLRWQDLDTATNMLRITQALSTIGGRSTMAEPKTKSSRREVPVSTRLAALFRRQRAQQREEQFRAGAAWEEHGLIFTTQSGRPVGPRNLVRDFKQRLKEAALPDFRFHDLRHACSSLLADQGVDARLRMELLGHADMQMTQNVYTHAYAATKRAAVEALDQVLALDRKAG